MARSARIAVTGIGVIAPQAVGIEAFSALLGEGRSAIREVDRFDTEGLRARKAALVTDFKGRDFIAPMKMRRMNVLSRWAVAASKLALSDAGREAAALDSTGVALGTAFGPVQTSVEYMQEYVEKGAAFAPPQLFAESVANAPGSHVAIEHGFRGFNVTITQRESSALSAAMYASSQLLKGVAANALTGGVDEVNEMLYSVLDRIGALAHAEEGIEEQSRPFDRDRNGLVLGEGGAILLLEREPRSEPYGFFSGFGMARDASAPLSDWGEDAQAVAAAMKLAIEDAGVEVEEIDAVYASANSTLRGDRLEARALRELFGDRQPPVVATKGIFGEYAAGGALQVAGAFLALRRQELHPSVGFAQADEGFELNIVTQRRALPLRHLLVNSLSAGGGIVSAVVSR
ncbi:MAG TPA: beta-ketoacyl synthase N-terminal-like domain-containing protein [Thermoanaerobaculia bacterium]|nr:beta-ketoacyl synthase N-terminal-like domain-containing protein [Thermoanaerobaculia bacterium]